MRPPIAFLLSIAIAISAQIQPPKTYQEASNAWFKLHPPPPDNASSEQRQQYDQQVAEASALWVKEWPNDPRVWSNRLERLARIKSTPNHELEEVGETLLQVAKEHPPSGFRFWPYQTDVADVWYHKNIRLEQSLELTQEAVRTTHQADLENPSAARQFMGPVVSGLFRTLALQTNIALELKKFDVAHLAVDQMKQYLDTHSGPPRPVDRLHLERHYWETAAYLAFSEGRKLDALFYNSEALRLFPQDSGIANRAHDLWTHLGGSEEGFKAWKLAFSEPGQPPPAVAEETSPWLTLDKPLTSFEGLAIDHKTWTISDLRGKTSLVNVWATWCRPCQEELPAVQTIFNQWKGRSDVQVITISVDKDVSWINRFAERQHYTFPIIAMAQEDVDKLAGFAPVPRTWIVDSSGVIRAEMPGYDPAFWPGQVLQQFDAVKKK